MKKSYAAAVLTIGFAAILVYLGTLHSPFLYDDFHTIVDNPYITDLKYIPEYFLVAKANSDKLEHSSWRPLWYLSFALNYRLGGLDTLGYHLFNIILHTLNSLLVFFLALLILKDRDKKLLSALIAGLVFALHPVQTEAVSNIVGRSALLAAFFYILAFILYVTFRDTGKKKWAALAGLSFLLALTSKENAVTLPLMVLAYEYILRGREKKPKAFIAALVLTSVLFSAFRLYIGYIGPHPTMPRNLLVNCMTEAYVVPLYILKAVFPFNLNIDHDVPDIVSILDPRLLVSIFVLAAIFYMLYRLWRANRTAGFLGLWFFVALIVETAMPIADVMVEHRLYLPLAGPSILAGLAAGALASSVAGRRKLILAVAGVAAFVSLGAATVARNAVYRSETSVWMDSAGKSPLKARPLYMSGLSLWRQGDLEGAVGLMERAVQLEPNTITLTGLGVVLVQLHRDQEAFSCFNQVLSADHDNVQAHYSLGTIYLMRKDYVGAIRELETTVRLAPDMAKAHRNLGSAYYRAGELDRSIDEYARALSLAPLDKDSIFNIAVAYERKGEKKLAVQYFRLYLKNYPGDTEREYDDAARVQKEIERLEKN
ncbi:MAG: tetratricopeptide repeat protein [Nitrospirota bacterium]